MTHPTHRDPLAELKRKTDLANRHNAKIVELLSSHDPLLHSVLSLDAKLALIGETFEFLARETVARAGRSTTSVADQETSDGSSEE